jgi:hypothetical protein
VSAHNGVSLVCNVVPFLASLSAISLQAIVFMKNCFLVLRRWDVLQTGFLHVFVVSMSGKSIRITLKLFLMLVVMPMNFEFLWCEWILSFSWRSQVAVLCDGVAVLLHTWSSFSSGVLETIWKVFLNDCFYISHWFSRDWCAVSHKFTHLSITGSSTMSWRLY